jgi:predicted HTH transcriptional regulator
LPVNLKLLISKGEGQQLDFKYCVSDSRKIARTLSAFANSDGGTLLIGVRDNGSIAGVTSEEEYYMIEAAASLYCKPEIRYTMTTHRAESKTVLEVRVEKGNDRPYLARNEEGRWLAYIRKKDQNLLANRLIINVWKRESNRKNILIKIRKPETLLLNYLKVNGAITMGKFKRLASINGIKAEKILTDFILLGIIDYDLTEKGCYYVPGREFESPINSPEEC